MPTIEVKVPDIGDFKDVPVIEVLVKPGDKVAKETSLVTLESDKATMDVPSPMDGTVKELKVKVGDKLSEGSLILTLESGACAAAEPAKPAAARRNGALTPALSRERERERSGARGGVATPGKADVECEMLVLGVRARRLLRRIPQRRPRHEDRARRALRHTRRRVPQRGLHSVEGAAAHGSRDGRSDGARCARHRVRRAADRPAEAAQVQGRRRQEADRRPRRHGEDAQGRGRARHRPLPRSRITSKSRSPPATGTTSPARRRSSSSTRRSSRRAARRSSCRSCRTIRAWSIPPARSSCSDSQAHARRRRRHHRPRDGDGVLGARHAASTSWRCSTS